MMKKLFILGLFVIVGCAGKVRIPDDFFEVSQEGYPQANGFVVFDSTFVKWNADGTGKLRTHYFSKAFTTYGKKKLGEQSFSYYSICDTAIVKYARTITPEGKVLSVPEDNITDMPLPAWEGSKFIIPNVRIIKISFPGLEKGGGIEYAVEHIIYQSPFDSVYDWWDIFEGDEPIGTKYFELSLPKTMTPNWKVVNGEIPYEEVDKGNRMVYIWEVKDVPRILREPSMPPIPDVATKLVITTRDSWEDGSHWYWEVCEPKLKPDSAIESKVAELIQGKETFEDTVRALYEFVNKKIRYLETALLGKTGGFAPQDISFSLKNKYGVCRDKAALLVGLLRTAGIEKSYTVLTNPVIEVLYEIPALTQFNHAIVAIEREGKWLYLDPTAEGAVEFLTPYEADKPVLVSTERGEDLCKTPKKPPGANTAKGTIIGKLDKDGVLKQSMITEGKGVTDMGLRQMVKHLPKEQMEQMFVQGIKSQYPGAKLDSIKLGDPEDFSIPMKLSIYFTIPDYPTVVANEWHIGAGGGEMTFSVGQMMGGNLWSLEERKYPLELFILMKTDMESRLYFPEGMKVKAVPESFSHDGKYMTIKTSHRIEKNCIHSTSELVFKEHRIPADDYKQAKELMDKLGEYRKQEIILTDKKN